MNLEIVVIVGLAVWRISSLLVNEDGPYDIFARMRHAVGVRYDEFSRKTGSNVIAKALTCLWCTSIWVALVAALFISDNPAIFLVNMLALSAVAILVNSLTER